MNISAIRGYNDNYISFTRYCSGFARNFIYFLPIDLDIDKKSRYENEYYCHEPYENEKYKIENYISNYSFKAFPYILTYLKENMDKTKSKKLEDLSGGVDSIKRVFGEDMNLIQIDSFIILNPFFIRIAIDGSRDRILDTS